MGEGFPVLLLAGTGPLLVGRRDHKDELVVTGLRQAKEGAASELHRVRRYGGLKHALVRAPLDVRAATGVNEVDPLLADVREVKAIEVLTAQLQHVLDLLLIEADDLEAPIFEHTRQAEADVLHRDAEARAQPSKNLRIDSERIGLTEEREDLVIELRSAGSCQAGWGRINGRGSDDRRVCFCRIGHSGRYGRGGWLGVVIYIDGLLFGRLRDCLEC